MSYRLTLVALAACTHPHDVVAVYAPAPPGAGAIDVVLNSPSGALTVAVDGKLVVDRKYSRKAHIDGVPPGVAHVHVATGGACEQGKLEDFEVDVEPGQTAVLAMPGPEPNHGCAVFSGLYYVGMNVGLVALAVLTLGMTEKQHVGFK
jgi:hypothetical protein